ncbi:hypothetical protein DVH24_042766 [Malus domestica]|uniref:Terpene synthase metal-binding domain-containing protein n=1 Tax=Malus domestica TaxID=3750 RepID=A0A498HZB1_MALDO|nr:hypothetical protein DVH24_042766 [Malus domestica]
MILCLYIFAGVHEGTFELVSTFLVQSLTSSEAVTSVAGVVWRVDMGLAEKLSFTRDRLMKYFFWSVGIIFEPQYSHVRKELTKMVALVTTIDDVYDMGYQSCRKSPTLHEAMFPNMYNTVNEMVYDTLRKKGENVLPYVTKVWVDLCKAFLREIMWCYNKHTPTFEEYIDNAWILVSGVVFLVHTYFLLNPKITKQALECLENQQGGLKTITASRSGERRNYELNLMHDAWQSLYFGGICSSIW